MDTIQPFQTHCGFEACSDKPPPWLCELAGFCERIHGTLYLRRSRPGFRFKLSRFFSSPCGTPKTTKPPGFPSGRLHRDRCLDENRSARTPAIEGIFTNPAARREHGARGGRPQIVKRPIGHPTKAFTLNSALRQLLCRGSLTSCTAIRSKS
jgi:hypothetical protein